MYSALIPEKSCSETPRASARPFQTNMRIPEATQPAMIQRRLESPSAPIFLDFWTAAYRAIDD